MNTKVETGGILEQYDFLKDLYYELEQLEYSGKTIGLDQIRNLKNNINERILEIETFLSEMAEALKNEMEILEMVA